MVAVFDLLGLRAASVGSLHSSAGNNLCVTVGRRALTYLGYSVMKKSNYFRSRPILYVG